MPLHGSKWSIFASLLICAVCAPCPAQNSSSVKVNEGETRLSFPGDHFHLALSITNGTAPASAQVSAELLDTDDSVRSAATGACNFTTGTTVCQIEMPPAIPHSKHGSNDGDWLPLFRLRYSVEAPGALPVSGTIALNRIAPELFDLHVATPKNIHLGTTYTARVRAMHPLTLRPRADVPLDVTLTANYAEDDKDEKILETLHLRTDADGFVSIPVAVPAEADLTSVDLDVAGTLANSSPQHYTVAKYSRKRAHRSNERKPARSAGPDRSLADKSARPQRPLERSRKMSVWTSPIRTRRSSFAPRLSPQSTASLSSIGRSRPVCVSASTR